MQVAVKLFAGFQKGRFVADQLDLPDGATVQSVVDRLEIPADEVGVMMVNGRHVGFDQPLSADVVLAIFPVVGGG
jgi:molybdopterin synthase sulfur carrier subunit